MSRSLALLLFLLCSAGVATAADMEITPFRSVNQNSLVSVYGIPAETSAAIAPSGKLLVSLVQDIASIFTYNSNNREQIALDGESYRWTVAARYGFGDKFEAGIEIPYILYGGGFLDSFIIDWHNAFSLPQVGRDISPKDRLGFVYVKDGVQKLRMRHAGSGVGDITLTGGMQLYDAASKESHDSLALRAALKLPSGDSSYLHGSGGTDFVLQFCGSTNSQTEWGTLGAYGSVGALAMSKGNVLSDQHNQFAGIGTVGLGWGPASWISFKVQLNVNTPLYRASSLDELAKSSLMLISGGAIKLPGDYLLDIGVAEDVAVATAPDVSFHLGLSKKF